VCLPGPGAGVGLGAGARAVGLPLLPEPEPESVVVVAAVIVTVLFALRVAHLDNLDKVRYLVCGGGTQSFKVQSLHFSWRALQGPWMHADASV
jgi:hypothetical protein